MIAPREPVPFAAVAVSTAEIAKVSPVTDGALAVATETEVRVAPVPVSVSAPSADALRQAVGTALTSAGHSSAAQLLGTANWTIDGASVRIEVPGIGKKMLSLTVNAAAEKIIRQELQRLGAPTRFMVVPGEGSAQAASMSAPAGSVQEAALAHPMVQRAKEIFNAEVRSVVDLRDGK